MAKEKIKLEMIDTDRNGDCFLLTEDWQDEWNCRGFLVEKGFRSDGISVPRVFWALVSPKTNPSARRAGVCHDWIYRVQPSGWTRSMADNMFFSFLRADGFGFFRAALCWLAVRLFGFASWVKDKHSKCDGCPMDCTHCYRFKKEDTKKKAGKKK